MKLAAAFLCLLATGFVSGREARSTPLPYDADLDSGRHGYYPVQKFVSSPLTAPKMNFLQWSSECNDGRLYFITPKGWSVSKPGPMILDSSGSMVWFQHFENSFGGQAYDLKVQRYKGEDYLTFWLGDDRVRGHGAGQYYMLNSSYDIVHRINVVDGLYADLHDLVITPQGTALMIIFDAIPYDVRPAGRKINDLWNMAIWDCLFQEVEIETGELIFQWRASEHLNFTKTFAKIADVDVGTQQNPFDPFHFNSVERDEVGNYLVSARNTHSIYYVNGTTGELIWTLGGKDNDFMDLSNGYALNFAWQHDARFVSPDAFPETYTPSAQDNGRTTRLLTLFDNAAVDWNYFYGLPYSRGLLLEITHPTPGSSKHPKPSHESGPARMDHRTQTRLSLQDAEKVASINGTSTSHTVRVLQECVNPKHVRSSTQGSLQLLANGKGEDSHVFLGYGLNAVMTEYSSNGSVLCDLHFGAQSSWERGDIQSYRAYKFPWVGRPRQPPAIAIRSNKAFVSWNGATEVHAWLLQQSVTGKDETWTELLQVPKHGFETAIDLPSDRGNARYLRVLGLTNENHLCENGVSDAIYHGYLSRILSQQSTGSNAGSIRWLMILLGFTASGLILYRLFLRYLSRRRTMVGSSDRTWKRSQA